MRGMFSYNSSLEKADFSGCTFNSNGISMSGMFTQTPNLTIVDFSDCNISGVTEISDMFTNSGVINLDLSVFDFSNISSADGFISECYSLEELILPQGISEDIIIDLPATFKDDNDSEYLKFDSNNLVPETRLVRSRLLATFLPGYSFNQKLKKLAGNSNATSSTADNNIYVFQRSTTVPDISTFTDDNIVSVSTEAPIYAWYSGGYIKYYCENETVYLNSDSSRMFQFMYKLSVVELENIDSSRATNMSYMFYYAGYTNVTSLVIHNLADWDTSRVTNMSCMFNYAGYSAKALQLGDISNWNTSKVTNMSYMFSYAGYYSTSFSLNLSNWDTSKVTNMSYMFSKTAFESTTMNIQGLSGWNTSSAQNMAGMFDSTGYKATTFSIGDFSDWNTSNVTNMRYMFCCTGYTATAWSIGDLSEWDTSKVENMSYMFESAGSNATTFNIGDLSNWDTSNVSNMDRMFYKVGYNSTTWNSIGTLKIYATNISYMFYQCSKAKATLKIYNNPTSYGSAFTSSATATGAGITVDYTSDVTNINNIISTKSSSSNVTKGSLFTA